MSDDKHTCKNLETYIGSFSKNAICVAISELEEDKVISLQSIDGVLKLNIQKKNCTCPVPGHTGIVLITVENPSRSNIYEHNKIIFADDSGEFLTIQPPPTLNCNYCAWENWGQRHSKFENLDGDLKITIIKCCKREKSSLDEKKCELTTTH